MTADPLAGLGPKVFVTDFDGTMTGVDFYELVLHHVPNIEKPDYWAECVAGRLTHVAALHGIFQQAPRDLAELTRWLPEAKLDPLTTQAVRQLRAAGWDIVVVSAGSEWYIRQLLDEVRDDVRIIANPGGYSDERGLWMGWPPIDALWHCPHFGVDKSKIVQHLIDRGATVAFAGDGRPDLSAIRRVAAPHRFARGWLSEVLATEGLDHQVFATWSDIAPRLTA
ncbi:MAG TPA: HAD-IB family phosphatase [Planctomycetaceae bacterium]|nr:HAD-IB family phosphatase [Planctomycetaceae bacterium]